MAITDQLNAQLDRLAEFDPGPFAVVSLYLNLQPNERGRDNFEPFLRKELAARLRTYPATGPERDSLDRDADRIRSHMQNVEASANGLALFACSGADLFEPIPLAAPIDEHRLYVSNEPHLYPLARLMDEYPRYAVLLADSRSARIFVIAANRLETTTSLEAPKTGRHKVGGWSQARYQRHIENFHLQHAKEAAEALARIVRDEGINSVLLSGDEAFLPVVREQLPKDVADRVVDEVKLAAKAADADVLHASMEALRRKDSESDRERVEALFDNYRAGGLACVGADDTLKAFERGQVDELLIVASEQAIAAGNREAREDRSKQERIADELIARARQTSAGVRFVEDPSLLASVGGVAAFLRFKL